VGDPRALDELVEKTEAELGGISLLINNAGLEQGMSYADVSAETIEQIIDVNLRAPMLLTHRVLPGMIERGEGHVCQIASVAGLLGTAYNETYSATKHGLVGFARGLRLTARSEGWPVEVTVVCPGFVSEAGMYEDIRAESGVEAPALLGTVPAEKVADEVLRTIVENDPEVVVNSTPIRPMLIASGLAPRLGDWLNRTSGAVELFRKSVHRPGRGT
jgi:short-subunit dehydrogenase